MLRPRNIEVAKPSDEALLLEDDATGKRVFLHKKGKVNLKAEQDVTQGEPLSVISNYPVRGKVSTCKFIALFALYASLTF